MRPKDCAYIVEHLSVRFMAMVADHSRQLAEHRAAFGARTEADRQIIEKLRAIVKEQSDHAKDAGTLLGWAPNESAFQAAKRVVKERDGLLTQVQDQRAEIERLRNDERKAYQDGEAMRVERDALRAEVAQHQKEHAGDQQAIVSLLSERDKLRAEVAAFRAEVVQLKAHTPKYKVGDKLELYSRLVGVAIPVTVVGVRAVYDCQADGAEYPVGHSEDELREVASHDTPAGKEAAEAVIRDSRMTEIEVGTKLRLCKVPMPDPQLSGLVNLPWDAEWGSVGDVAEVINTLNPASLPVVAVRLESELVVWWPRSCIEIVRKVPQ